jgi:ABC-type branched-subunit amino acid transport system ATPase component/ABC-type branched-subunit amino acid transport system permease subunit
MRLPDLAVWQWRGLAVAAVVVAWIVLGAIAPNGLPLGVALLGVVLGALSGLTAMGLVLIYRASRVVNFAQAEFGGLATTVAVVLTNGTGLPLWAGMLLGLVAALLTGVITHELVVRRLFRAPRLILTVATIGVAQLVAAGEIYLPHIYTQLRPLDSFHTHLPLHFWLGPIHFGSDAILVLIVVAVLLPALALFLTRSDVGTAVRAAAEAPDRALLLGIPVRRLSLLAWTVAAGLSGIGSMLAAPVLGPQIGVASGPLVLLAPLVAAVIARMESLPVALGAGIGLGVLQQAIFWNYPSSSTVDVVFFLIVLVAMLGQRRRLSRQDEGALGDHVAVREVRPIPAPLQQLTEVRAARIAGTIVLALIVLGVPLLVSDPHRGLLAYVAIYCIVAASLVVLTGWAGQISLGQFAFVGLGAGMTGALLVHAHADFFLAMVVSALLGAGAAVVVGIPALRIRGLFLAVTTLAFGVPVSTFLLNSAHVAWLSPATVPRPMLLDRFSLDDPLTFCYLCIAVAAVTVVLARNFRAGRVGRVVVAVRDNERAASMFGIEPVRAKLTAFAFSGALAGAAGALYVAGLRGIPFSGFDPEQSLVVFTMVIIGGAASLPGALLGAVYVEGAQYFLTGAAQLLATGVGLLVLVLFVPGGLGQLAFALRDRWLLRVADRRGLSVPSLREHPDRPEEAEDTVAAAPDGLLTVSGVRASYGRNPVLFGVDLGVPDGGLQALLGTNGAGKSTVLKVVSGLLAPDSGQVVFDGEDITALDPVARLKRGLVLVPGGRGVFPSQTVRANLRMAAWLYRRDRAAFDESMRWIGELFPILHERADVPAGELSGGQQQMLAIAQGLIGRPRVLMIDELSLGLAPTIVAQLVEVIRKINASGTTVLIVEQSVNIATAMADEAVFMEKGQVRFAGRTTELTQREDIVRAVFLRGDDAQRAPVPRQQPALDATPRLEARGVGCSFGGVRAVDEVDLVVPDGAIVGIIGANGAGKTTLFDLCAGFVTPDRGRILLDGRDVTALTPAARARGGLGRTFQDARLFPSMTVTEVLATALERHLDVREPMTYVFRLDAALQCEADVHRTVDELLELMNLGRYRDAFVGELSTGTRRIVELACVIAHAPRVLLLDEPSAGIAQREVEALRDVLLRVRRDTGAALAIVEHDIPLLSSVCDSMVCMHLGRVIATGSPEQVLAEPLVVASYLGTDPAAIARSDVPGRRSKTATGARR